MTRKNSEITIHCPLNKETRPTTVGGPACELCSAMITLSKRMNDLSVEFNNSPMVREYKKIREDYNILENSHRKCDGCGICFGGYHIAKKFLTIDKKSYCQYCVVDIKKNGIKSFNERIGKGNSKGNINEEI